MIGRERNMPADAPLIYQQLRIASVHRHLHDRGFAAARNAMENHCISSIRPAKEMARGAGGRQSACTCAVRVDHPDFQPTALVRLKSDEAAIRRKRWA